MEGGGFLLVWNDYGECVVCDVCGVDDDGFGVELGENGGEDGWVDFVFSDDSCEWVVVCEVDVGD